MGEHDRIRLWLQHTNLQEYNEDVDEVGDGSLIEPVTPPRRQLQLLDDDDFSPVSTSFSVDSIFDAPGRQNGSGFRNGPFQDAVSEHTSINDGDWDSGGEAKTIRSATLENLARTESLASYEPPSEIDESVGNSVNTQQRTPWITAPPPIDPIVPRLTAITSCTQCIQANLPCSRTAPSCSRCKRKGQADVCLLHRRKFPEEIRRSEATCCTVPVLLKLRSEDEKAWNAKLKLSEEVRFVTTWVFWIKLTVEQLAVGCNDEQDRKNWVLPSVESARGDFRSRAMCVPRRYLGDGRGDWIFQELQVDVED